MATTKKKVVTATLVEFDRLVMPLVGDPAWAESKPKPVKFTQQGILFDNTLEGWQILFLGSDRGGAPGRFFNIKSRSLSKGSLTIEDPPHGFVLPTSALRIIKELYVPETLATSAMRFRDNQNELDLATYELRRILG